MTTPHLACCTQGAAHLPTATAPLMRLGAQPTPERAKALFTSPCPHLATALHSLSASPSGVSALAPPFPPATKAPSTAPVPHACTGDISRLDAPALLGSWADGPRGVLFSAAQLGEATGGTIVQGGPDGSLCTDTRRLRPGDWFLALQGPNFDGNAFLEEAARRGCGGALGQGPPPPGWAGGFVRVADGRRALLDLGAWIRARYRGPVVAITGSSGKTTVRALTALALDSLGSVFQTSGNENNAVGVPLTLAAMPSTSAACVLELGMNQAGEIAELAAVASPTVRLICNVGPCHLAGLGTVENVARAKGELFDSASVGDVCIVNADDAYVAALPVPAGVRVVKFGRKPGSHVRLVSARTVDGGLGVEAVLEHEESRVSVHIRSPGLHLAMNACAAAAAAVALGVPIAPAGRAMERYRPVGARMRLELVPLGRPRAAAGGTTGAGPGIVMCAHASGPALAEAHGPDELPRGSGAGAVYFSDGGQAAVGWGEAIMLIDDVYNANPMSVRAAVELLTVVETGGGRMVAVLGDMHELGPEISRRLHAEALQLALERGVDLVALVGPEFGAAAIAVGAARAEGGERVILGETASQVASSVVPRLRAGDVVLVKGSRSMRMEVVSEAIRSLAGRPG